MANINITQGNGLERGIRLGMSIDEFNQRKKDRQISRGYDAQRQGAFMDNADLTKRLNELNIRRQEFAAQRDQAKAAYEDEVRPLLLDTKKAANEREQLQLITAKQNLTELNDAKIRHQVSSDIKVVEEGVRYIQQNGANSEALQDPGFALDFNESLGRLFDMRLQSNASDNRKRKFNALVPTPDQKGFFVNMEIEDNGKTEARPMTEGGGSDPKDKVKIFTLDAIMQDVSNLKTLVNRLDFIDQKHGTGGRRNARLAGEQADKEHQRKLEIEGVKASGKGGMKQGGYDLKGYHTEIKKRVDATAGKKSADGQVFIAPENEEKYKRLVAKAEEYGTQAFESGAIIPPASLSLMVDKSISGIPNDEEARNLAEDEYNSGLLNMAPGIGPDNNQLEQHAQKIQAEAIEAAMSDLDNQFNESVSKYKSSGMGMGPGAAPAGGGGMGGQKQLTADEVSIRDNFVKHYNNEPENRGKLIQKLKMLGYTPEDLGLQFE